jgi:hypothetical protein
MAAPFTKSVFLAGTTAVGSITGLGAGVATWLASGTRTALATLFGDSFGVGYLGVPQNSQSAAYTTVLADAGKEIYHPVGDNNARQFTIDSNANVAYPIGTVIIFTNMAATSSTIAITSDTLYLFGAGTTGTRTLAQYGTAAARKLTSTTWGISGTNLT